MDKSMIWERVKMILFKPQDFFDNTKHMDGIGKAFSYFAIVSLICCIIGGFVFLLRMLLILPFITSLIPSESSTPLAGGAAFLIMCMITLIVVPVQYLFGLINSFVGGGVLYLWLKLFGGKGTYSKAYQLHVYSGTPYTMFRWIPGLDFLSWIYALILVIMGTHKWYGFSKTKSTLIFVVPVILFVIVVSLALVVFLWYYLQGIGSVSY